MYLPQSLGRHLRVITWNIHKGIGGVDRRYRLQRIIEVIRHYQPDIALLQEVAQGIPRLHKEDQVATLTEAFNYYAKFHPEHQFKQGGYGNLILSRWPILHSEHLDLTINWRKRRGLLLAQTRIPCGSRERTVAVANLHLGLAGSERKQQLRRVLAHPSLDRRRAEGPMILGGDLNDLWGTLGPALLVPRGYSRAGKMHRTFPAALPLRPLDGIFFSGPIQSLRCDTGRTATARAASDHLPIYSDFRLT